MRPCQLTWGSGPNSAGGHASVIFVEEVQVGEDLYYSNYELRRLTSFVPYQPDPAHDAADQAHPRGKGAVSCGP